MVRTPIEAWMSREIGVFSPKDPRQKQYGIPGGAAYSTLRLPPQPPSEIVQPFSSLPQSTACCLSPSFPKLHPRVQFSSVSPQRRRGSRFGRSITPPRLHKRVKFSASVIASSADTSSDVSSMFTYSARLAREQTYSVADSGANVSVTNPAIVARFGLTPQPWKRPFNIVFGNNSEFHCTEFADFGPVLGKVAIVDNAPDTLISIASLAERGIETRFNSDLGVGLFFNGQLLYKGRQNPRTKLFELDIATVAELSLGPDSVRVLTAKQGAVDASLIKEVLWLHKRMGHPSREDMATALLHST